MQKTEKITVRLTPDQIDTLNTIVKQEKLGSVSEAIRGSVEEFIKSRITPVQGAQIEVKFPRGDLRKINVIVECEEFLSAQELIRTAVKEYVNKKVDETLERGRRMDEMEKRRIFREEEEAKISKYMKT
ncbi:MAG: hypothetical protein QMC80_02910 [Thermoplasmatales archaeon]|nr:hypothetical protein [Thermoplasmatales archaeon]